MRRASFAPERPRAKGTDPFDILAALGTERALPQRRDPLKSGVAPKPAEQPEPEDSIQEYPVTDERLQEMAPAADFEEMAPAADFEEIAHICHRALVFSRGRIVRELSGADLTTSAVISAASASEAA